MRSHTRALAVVVDDVGLDPCVAGAVAVLRAAGVPCLAAHLVTGSAPPGPGAAAHAGLHLDLSQPGHRPLGPPHAALCAADGTFAGRDAAWKGLQSGTPSVADWVEAEVLHQLEAARAAGVVPVHLSGHHHVHATPLVATALVSAFRRLALPAPVVRGFAGGWPAESWLASTVAGAWAEAQPIYQSAGWPTTRLIGLRWTQCPGRAALRADLQAVASAPTGPLEWMVHPAHGARASRLSLHRVQELQALLDPELWAELETAGYRLMTGANLAREAAES